MGSTKARMRPKRMHARGRDEVMEIMEMTKEVVMENQAGGLVDDMDTQRKANRSRSMLRKRKEAMTSS